MSEILPPVIINNSPNIIIPTLHEDGNQVGPLFQTGTQGPVGPMGPQGPNIISEETQSDGTANISIAGLTIGDSLTLNGENYSYSESSLLAHRVALNIDEVDNTNDLDKPISTATQTALNNKVDKVEGKELSDENFTSTEKSKLSGIEEGAEVNVNADWTATSGDAEILNKPILGSAAAANITDFATAAQGELADSALQPQSVNYLGEYNNGADYNPGAVVLYAGILYIRVGEANPGYPPGTSYWTEYNPEIGSPAYDLYVQTTLANKSNVGHSHSSNDITDFNGAASDAAPVQSINDRVGDIVLTKSDVGLDNVDNTSDADKPISTATQTALNNKVDVVIGKGLSDENFTSAEKIKLDGIAAGAEVNVNADWNATSGDAQILNKPSTIAGYNITDAVATSGAQHIDGVKTFTSSPLVPDLTVNSSSSSAVNKAYVDNVATGIHVHGEVHVILKNSTLAAASGGTVAYTNGNNGIGAKLTITGGSSVVDALNAACGSDPDLTIGSRVIIAGETNAAWNGIYTISATRELTRATDADTPAKMNGGDFVFVTHGTIHADTGWICSEPVTTVGVSPVIFVQFSGSGAYDAGVGLQRDGTLFSVKTPVGGAIVADSNGINLVASGVTPNTYGSSTQSAVVTVNDKGLVTGASSSTITPALGSITGLGSNVAAFLADPTSAKLAVAVVNSKTGTDALVFGTAPTISSPTINTALTLNATTYNYGAGAAAAHRSALGLGTAATTDSTSYAAASHSHGNITNAGAIGSTSGLVVTTTTNGILTTSSRSGIDSRTSFPNSDVTAATSAPTVSTIVKRDSDGASSFNEVTTNSLNIDGNVYFNNISNYSSNATFTYNGSSVTAHRTALNINNVDNTSDANKPISIATQTALNSKSDIGHGHSINDVSGLQTALNSKQPVGDYATKNFAIAMAIALS